jgi:hypothetical protein
LTPDDLRQRAARKTDDYSLARCGNTQFENRKPSCSRMDQEAHYEARDASDDRGRYRTDRRPPENQRQRDYVLDLSR